MGVTKPRLRRADGEPGDVRNDVPALPQGDEGRHDNDASERPGHSCPGRARAEEAEVDDRSGDEEDCPGAGRSWCHGGRHRERGRTALEQLFQPDVLQDRRRAVDEHQRAQATHHGSQRPPLQRTRREHQQQRRGDQDGAVEAVVIAQMHGPQVRLPGLRPHVAREEDPVEQRRPIDVEAEHGREPGQRHHRESCTDQQHRSRPRTGKVVAPPAPRRCHGQRERQDDADRSQAVDRLRVEVCLVDHPREDNRRAEQHGGYPGHARGPPCRRGHQRTCQQPIERDQREPDRSEAHWIAEEDERTARAAGEAALADVVQALDRQPRVRDQNRARDRPVQDPDHIGRRPRAHPANGTRCPPRQPPVALVTDPSRSAPSAGRRGQ